MDGARHWSMTAFLRQVGKQQEEQSHVDAKISCWRWSESSSSRTEEKQDTTQKLHVHTDNDNSKRSGFW
jgi:hypothetical protein